MRLIDGDALTETIGIRLYSGAVMEFVSVEDIAKQPTVDAEPVRHGKWIRKKDTRFGEMLNDILICSECQIAFSTVTMIRRSYCPNCGARMSNET